jgi:hypothetical protein
MSTFQLLEIDFASNMDCDATRIFGSRTELSDFPTRCAVLTKTKAWVAYGLRLNYVVDLYSHQYPSNAAQHEGLAHDSSDRPEEADA